MTKTIKLSLAAALLATSVSAVEFSTSGKMEVEYDYTDTYDASATTTTTTNQWDLDVDATVKAKFNDNFTGVVTVQADDLENTNSGNTTNDNVDVAKHYVQYTNGGTTVLAGKQSVGTPFFDDERANGVVLLQKVAGVTVAAANFTGINNDSDNSSSISVEDLSTSAQAIIGSVGSVNYSLWTAQVSNLADAYSANVTTKLGNVALDIRHSEADYENTTNDAELTEVKASTTVGAFNVSLAYGETSNTNAASTAGVDLTEDNDATTNFGLDIIDIDDWSKADATVLSASTKLGGATVTLAHLDGNADTVDLKETKVSFAYPLASGAKLTGKYSTAEGVGAVAQDEKDIASLAVEFKF